MEDNNKNRLQTLDSFRGIASIAVVLFHFTTLYFSEFNYSKCNFSFSIGHFGVQFFFILSGFVIFLSVKNVTNPIDFIKKRIVRLYPAYWICIVISFLVVHFFGMPNFRVSSVKDLLFGLTMLNGFIGVTNIDCSYWSLRPELVFYFFIALMLLLKGQKYVNAFILVSTCLLVLDFIKPFPLIFSRALNIPFCAYFFSGIYFYFFYKSKETKYLYLTVILCIINVILDKNEFGVVVIPIIYLLFFLFLINKLNFINSKPVLFLGYISYPIYLIHQNVGMIIIYRFLEYFPNCNYFIAMFIAISIVVFISYLIAKIGEPFLQTKVKKILIQ